MPQPAELRNTEKEKTMEKKIIAKKTARESGIELLRILAAIGVVLLHYNDGKAFTLVQNGSAQQYTLYLLESIAICAVDLFILISGFFLSGTQKRSNIKPLELIFQVIFFHVAIYLVNGIFFNKGLSFGGLLIELVPNNYFAILYIALYFISPYINAVLKRLDQKQWKTLLIIVIGLFSVWNTAVDLGKEFMGQEILGLSTVSRTGSHQGFTIVNFCTAYVIGAWLRYGSVPKWMQKKSTVAIAWAGTVLVILLWSIANQKLTSIGLRSAWVYHNPFVLLSAALLFQLFRSLHFRSSAINRLAGASFTCFLVHGELLGYAGIKSAVAGSPITIVGHVLLVLIAVYLISWIIHELYTFLTAWIFKRLGKLKLFGQWSVDI